MAKLKVSLGFTTDTAQAKRQIDDLAQSLKKITENSASILDDTDLKAGVQAAKDLEKHLQKAFNVDTGKIDLSKFSRSLDSSGQSLKSLQKNLSKLGADGDQAFLNLSKSIISAEAPTLRLNSHVKNLLDDLIKVSRWQLSSSIMHGFMGTIQTAYGYSQDLNESLTNIGIVTGRNAEQMANFADKANIAAKALSTTTVDYADASLIYYQQGLPEEQIEERTAITIKMANAVGQSVETVSDQLTAIWNNYYDGSKSLQYYADVLMRLGADTASSSDEISEGLSKFSAVADTIGLSYEYAASALATITATTRESANTVGTALKTLFSRIQGLKLGETLDDGTDLNKYSEALSKVGVNIKDANGELKDMDIILNEVGAKWEVLGKDQQMALAQAVAGVRQYNQFIALMDNWGYFQELLTSSINSTGALEEQAEIFEESWKASLNRVRASAEGVYNALINDDFFIKANDTFAGMLTGVEGLVEGLGGMNGLISTGASLLLSTYAKEIPEVFDNLLDNIKIASGLTSKTMEKVQADVNNALRNKQFASDTKSLEIERQALIKIGEARQNLIAQSKNMSAAEQKEAQEKINTAEAIGQKIVSMQKELELQEKTATRQFNSGIEDLVKETVVDYTQIGNLSNQIEQLKNEGEEATAEIEELNSEIIELTEAHKYLPVVEKIEDLEEITGLTAEQLKALGKIDATKAISKQADDTKEAFKALQTTVNNTQQKIQEYTLKGSAINKLNDGINNQINSWKNIDLSIDEARSSIQEYVKNLSLVNQKYNLELNLDANGTFKELEAAIKNPQSSLEDLKNKFQAFLQVMSGQATAGIGKFSDKTDELTDRLTQLLGGSDKAKEAVRRLRIVFEELGDGTVDVDSMLKMLLGSLDQIDKTSVRAGTALAHFTSSLMAVNAQINALENITRVFSDETASGIEKVGAALGLVITSIESITALTQGLSTITTFIKGLSGIEKAAKGAQVAQAGLNGTMKAGNIIAKANPYIAIATVIIGVISGVILFTQHQKEANEAIREGAEEAKKLADENKQIISSNKDLVSSMRDALSVYEETGEGKEQLDNLTQQLADAYGIEGSALATLTGDYENYNKVLEQAIRLQKEQQKNHLKELQNVQKENEKVIFNDAGEGFNDSYGIAHNEHGRFYNSIKNTSTADKQKQYNKIFNDFLVSKGFDTNLSGSQFSVRVDDTVEDLEKLYDAYEEFINKYKDDEDWVKSDIYQYAQEWIKKMEASMSVYKTTAEELNIQEGIVSSQKADINNLEQYREWAKQYGDNIHQIMSSVLDEDLQEFYNLDLRLNSILASGTEVSEEKILRLWNSLEQGKSKYDEITLSAVKWGALTNENYQTVLENTQAYYDAIDLLQRKEETRYNAKEALDKLEKQETVNLDNYYDLKELINWGDAEQQIIEFNNFLNLTYEEQQKYLTGLTERTIYQELENQITAAENLIEEYKGKLAALEDSMPYEEYSELVDLYSIIQSKGAKSEMEINYSGIDFSKLGIDSKGFEEFKGLTQEEFDEWTKDLRLKVDNMEITRSAISQYESQLKDLENQEQIEIDLIYNKQQADKTIALYEELGEAISINPDLSQFQEKINSIINNDYGVEVIVEAKMKESIQEAIDKTNDLTKAASLIGDEYLVAADDLMTLGETFPGILQGYTVMSDGMIQLNSDQVDAALRGAKDEVNANFEVQRQKLEGEKIVAQEKIKVLQNQISNIEAVLNQEVEATQGAQLEEVLISLKGTNEKLGHESDLEKASKEADKEIALGTAEAAEDRAESVRKYVELAMKYMDILEKFENASGEDREKYRKEIYGLRETAINSGYDPTVMNDVAEKYVNSEAYETKEGFDEFKRQFLEDLYKNTTENGKSILGQYLEDQIADAEKQIQEQQKIIDSSNSIIGSLNAQEQSAYNKFKNTVAGLGSDGKKDSGNKDNEPEEYETVEPILLEEHDAYADINNDIEENTRLRKRQAEATSRLDDESEEYLQSLEEEAKLVDAAVPLYEEKQRIVEEQLEKQKKALQDAVSSAGVEIELEFNDNGTLLKETDTLNAIYNDIQQRINEATERLNNSADKAERERNEKEIETLQKYQESIQAALDTYIDTLNLMREVQDMLLELQYAKEDLQIEQQEWYTRRAEAEEEEAEKQKKAMEDAQKEFEKMQEERYDKMKEGLDLSIKVDENSLKMLDFYIDRISDDFYSMAEAASLMVNKIPTITNSLGSYQNFYGQISSAYAAGEINAEDYADGLQTAYDGIMDNLQALVELDKEMMHYYEDTLQAAQDEIGHYTDSLEHLTSVLEHYKNIVELVDGEYNFDAIDTILRGQTKTIENEMEVAKATYEMMLREKQAIEASMASVEVGSDAWELFNNELQAITEAVNEAEDQMLSKTEEWAEAMKAVMENTFKEAAYKMEMSMTQGMGFDALNSSLDRLSAYQEVYLTTTNEIYELSKLMRTAQQAADKTDAISSKQKLKAYMKEIDTLKNDGIPLSQFELDLAKARYDVLLAEIALEEAQNAKSTVRLQRDSEGNFGYVYTADGDAIMQAEQDLADAQNKLYNIGLEATNEYGQKMLELQQQLSDDLLQLEQDRADGRFQTEAEYEEAKARLIEEYNALFLAYSDQYTTALGTDVAIQEEAWIMAYDSMINQTQNWADYTTMYTQACEQAYEEWRTAVAEHNQIIQDVLNNTKEKVDDVTTASNNLKEKVLKEVIPAVSTELRQVRDITSAYAMQRAEINNLIDSYIRLAQEIANAMAAQAAMAAQESSMSAASTPQYDLSGIPDFSQAMADYLEISGNSTQDSYYQALVQAREEKVKQDEYSQFGGQQASNMLSLMDKYEQYNSQGISNELTDYVESINRDKNKFFNANKIKDLISRFASGGYTGEWGPSGRLAVLHQKELVLNANDTLNFLKAAEILRQVSGIIDLSAMSNSVNLNPYNGMLSSALADSVLQQEVRIEANFPGVQDRYEIEEAFNNLINTASQYANRK